MSILTRIERQQIEEARDPIGPAPTAADIDQRIARRAVWRSRAKAVSDMTTRKDCQQLDEQTRQKIAKELSHS